MTDLAAPVAKANRIELLDVLRGLALLGILMVNTPSYAMPQEITGDPSLSPLGFEEPAQRVWWLMRTFFEQKFINLFTMLFGVSLFLVGGERDDPVREPVLTRRLLWLSAFGVIHGAFIWWGDILLHYAAIGFLMFLFRSWAPRRLIIVGLILFAVGLLLNGGALGLVQLLPDEQYRTLMSGEVNKAIESYQGGLGEVQLANAADWGALAIASLFVFGPRTLGMMMIGLALYKTGVLTGRRSAGFYAALALAGAAALAVIGWSAAREVQSLADGGTGMGMISFPNHFLSPVATLGYIALMALALRGAAFRWVGAVLAPVGRMAFTNYIAQSLIMSTIFYGGRGLGWYGRLDWPEWSLIVLGVWAVQLVWSPLWLSRFSMGPLEWVWRRLSYGRAIPLRRTPEPTAA